MVCHTNMTVSIVFVGLLVRYVLCMVQLLRRGLNRQHAECFKCLYFKPTHALIIPSLESKYFYLQLHALMYFTLQIDGICSD